MHDTLALVIYLNVERQKCLISTDKNAFLKKANMNLWWFPLDAGASRL